MRHSGNLTAGVSMMMVCAIGLLVVPGRQIGGFDITMLSWIIGIAGLVIFVASVGLEVTAYRARNALHVYDGDG